MKRLLLFCLLAMAWTAQGASSYTDFYCDASASANNTNVNAGSTTGAPVYGPSASGDWDATALTFTPTDGTTPASTVSAGMWASVYVDGSTNLVQTAAGGAIFLVYSVAAGANGVIQMATNGGTGGVGAGTSPATGSGTRTIRVGGCWKGPWGNSSATMALPFGFIANTATNGPGYAPKVWFKNTASYMLRHGITHSLNGPAVFAGYNTSTGDAVSGTDTGKFTIDGTGTASAIVLLNIGGTAVELSDCIVTNNGTSGGNNSVSVSGAGDIFYRVSVRSSRSQGISASANLLLLECSVQNWNTGAAEGTAGFSLTGAGVICDSCIAIGAGSKSVGFGVAAASCSLLNCIAANCGDTGFKVSSTSGLAYMRNCDDYGNSTNGVWYSGTFPTLVAINCNHATNTFAAVTNSAAYGIHLGKILNNGLTSGTMANGSGIATASLGGVDISGTVTYPADQLPWSGAATTNFTLTLSQAKSAGYRKLPFTLTTPTVTAAWADIGAANAATTNTSSAGGAYSFAQ